MAKLITLTLKGDKQLKAKLLAISPTMRRQVNRSMERAVRRIHASAVENAPVGQTGQLRTGLNFDLNTTALSGRIFSNERYAVSIHEGLKPKQVFPNYRKRGRGTLQGWVGTKLAVPADRRQTVAFLVARKINREGTDAQPFLADAIRSNAVATRLELEEVLGAGIEAELKQ